MPNPVVRRLGLAAAAAALAFAGVELAARSRARPTEPIPDRWHERFPQPYTMFGRCQRPPTGPKPDGEFRVVMLGGSTVALGEPPLPDLLEAALRRRGHGRARVYNCGAVSQNSGQQLARLLFEVADHAPDLVVAYDGGNDVMDPYQFDPRPGYPMNFLAYERNPLMTREVSRYPLLPLLLLGSQALRDAFPDYFAETLLELPLLRRQQGYLTAPWRERIARRYADHHRKAALVAAALDARYAVFLQPLLFYARPPRPAAPGFEDGMWAHAPAAREAIRARLRAAPLPPPARFFDLSDLFAGAGGEPFADFIHVKQPAREAVAEALAARLHEARLLSPAGRQ
ncbi:MAG: hypothetical protein SF051_10895 [Elusimicrobiota bacterium]|nr:hypothetical protein [Elusimicrobiota bacterium]